MTIKINKSKHNWNNFYRLYNDDSIHHENWIIKHDHLFHTRENILEVGCGFGYNSLYLISKGHDVLSTDFSAESLKKLKSKSGQIQIRKIDLRKRIKLKANSFDTIVADLCLHYFDIKTTSRILSDFHSLLKPDGKLFCRINSIFDINHGAGQGIEIEKNFYYLDGLYKRFFDKTAIEQFFSDWEILYCVNEDIFRFEKKKNVFEIVCRQARALI